MKIFAPIIVICVLSLSGLAGNQISFAASSQPHLMYNLYIDKEYHGLFAKLWHSTFEVVFSLPDGREAEFQSVIDQTLFVLGVTGAECGYQLVTNGGASKSKVLISFIDDFDKIEKNGLVKIYRKSGEAKEFVTFSDRVKKIPNKLAVFSDKLVSVINGVTMSFVFVYVPQELQVDNQLLLRKAIYKSIFNLSDKGLLEQLAFPEMLELKSSLKSLSSAQEQYDRTCDEYAFIHLLCKYGGKQNMSVAQLMENSEKLKAYCIKTLKVIMSKKPV